MIRDKTIIINNKRKKICVKDKDYMAHQIPEYLGRRLDKAAVWQIWFVGLAVILAVILIWKLAINDPITRQAVRDTDKMTVLRQEVSIIEKQAAAYERRIPGSDALPEIVDDITACFLAGDVIPQEFSIGQQTQENEGIVNVFVTVRVNGDLDKILTAVCRLQERQTYPLLIQNMDIKNGMAEITILIPIADKEE